MNDFSREFLFNNRHASDVFVFACKNCLDQSIEGDGERFYHARKISRIEKDLLAYTMACALSVFFENEHITKVCYNFYQEVDFYGKVNLSGCGTFSYFAAQNMDDSKQYDADIFVGGIVGENLMLTEDQKKALVIIDKVISRTERDGYVEDFYGQTFRKNNPFVEFKSFYPEMNSLLEKFCMEQELRGVLEKTPRRPPSKM